MLTVATKMIIQILPDSWILRVAWNTVDPYTIPRPNHSLLRINGIRKCDRNIKYSAAVLPSNFEIRVVCDGPTHASCSCVYVGLFEIFVLDVYNTFSWVNSSLYGESRCYLISKRAPDSAT